MDLPKPNFSTPLKIAEFKKRLSSPPLDADTESSPTTPMRVSNDKFNKILEKIVDLSNNVLIEKDGKLYKGSIEIVDDGKLLVTKNDKHDYTITDADVQPIDGKSGSTVKQRTISGMGDYIQKNLPKDRENWGGFIRELVVMEAIRTPEYILLPEYIILKDKLIQFEGITSSPDDIALLTKACAPCRQNDGKNCVKDNEKFTWSDKDLSKKEDLLKFIEDIENGIKEMNNNDFYHKDVKPDNIVYCNDKFQLIDFGLTEKGVDSALKNSGTARFAESNITQKTSVSEIVDFLIEEKCLSANSNENDKEFAVKAYLRRLDYFALFTTLKIIVKNIAKYKMLYEFFELIIDDFTKSFNKELYDVDDIMNKIKLILNIKIGTVCKIIRDGREERREVSIFDQLQSQESSQESSQTTIDTPTSSSSWSGAANEGGRKRRNTRRKKHKNGNKKQRKTKRRKN